MADENTGVYGKSHWRSDGVCSFFARCFRLRRWDADPLLDAEALVLPGALEHGALLIAPDTMELQSTVAKRSIINIIILIILIITLSLIHI